MSIHIHEQSGWFSAVDDELQCGGFGASQEAAMAALRRSQMSIRAVAPRPHLPWLRCSGVAGRFPTLDGIPAADWLACREIERQMG